MPCQVTKFVVLSNVCSHPAWTSQDFSNHGKLTVGKRFAEFRVVQQAARRRLVLSPPHGVNTSFKLKHRTHSILLGYPVNPVEKRILELASFQFGNKRKFIRAVGRKVVVRNRRYSWMLFENLTDPDPVETVVLDVNQEQALEIDRKVAERFPRTILVCAWENLAKSRESQAGEIRIRPTVR